MKLALEPQAQTIVCASRMAREKGIEFVLRAFDSLAGKFPESILVLVGDGCDFDELAATASQCPSASRIHFVGFQEDPSPFIAAADIAVSYADESLQEAFGLAVAEAMAWGVPVVAAQTGGVEEFMRDGIDGLLVPAANTPALSAALEQLLSDRSYRRSLGKGARQRAEEHLGFDRWAADITEELQSVVLPA